MPTSHLTPWAAHIQCPLPVLALVVALARLGVRAEQLEPAREEDSGQLSLIGEEE